MPPPRRRSKRIGFFLSAFYYFLRTLVRAGLLGYYRHHVILQPERLRFDGPGIVVSNHPSTLMDPFNAVAFLNRIMHFLINYGLVRSAAGNWFFNNFYCIPIKRASDLRRGESRDNSDAFERSNQHLVEGGVLYIAVEGTSVTERRLRPTKTGAARIVLAAEAANDFQLGVRILPVGLNYSAPLKFRSDAVIDLGESFTATHYREQYAANPKRAIYDLTQEIDHRLRAQLIDTSDDDVDAALRAVETLYQTTEPTHPAGQYRRARRWHRALEDWKTTTAETFDAFAEAARAYQDALKKSGTSDRAVAGWRPGWREWSELFVGFPLFMFGALTHLFAAGVPWFIEQRAGVDITYRSTIRYLLGILLVPLFYVLNWWIFYWTTGNSMWVWLLLAATLPCGLYAWNWNLLRREIFGALQLRDSTLRNDLERQRALLTQMLSDR